MSVVLLPALVIHANYAVYGGPGPNQGREFFGTTVLPLAIVLALMLVAALNWAGVSARTHLAVYGAYLTILLCVEQAFFIYDYRR